jgi:hypothetical protein
MIFAVFYFEIVKSTTILWYQLALLCRFVFFYILRMITTFTSIIWELCHALWILGEWIRASLCQSHHSSSATPAHLRSCLRIRCWVHYHRFVSFSELFEARVLEGLTSWHTTILVVDKQFNYHVLYIRLHMGNQLSYTCAFLLRKVKFHMWSMPKWKERVVIK